MRDHYYSDLPKIWVGRACTTKFKLPLPNIPVHNQKKVPSLNNSL